MPSDAACGGVVFSFLAGRKGKWGLKAGADRGSMVYNLGLVCMLG